MLTAIQNCKAANQAFEDVFARQYCLMREDPPEVEGWMRESQSGWWLTHCSKLPCRTLQDAKGAPVGWLLGVAVEEAAQALDTSPYELKAAQDTPDFWTAVEHQVTALSGSYAAIVVTQAGARMYFDPVMNLPAVYHAKARTVASSPIMTLSRPLRRNYRINHERIITEGGNYGMGQTCDPDVMRGMSNHYLDLETFTLHRHWPNAREEFVLPDDTLEETAEFITDRLGRIAGALINAYDCVLPLSGGADSRTLAFSAKSHMEKVRLIYSHRTNKITGVDCFIADQLATVLGHELHLIDARDAMRRDVLSKSDIDRLRWVFFQTTGYTRAPSDQELVAKYLTPPAELVLRGNILDMARANQWPPSFDFSLPHAIGKLNIGGRPMDQNTFYWGAEYCNWLETVPQNAKQRLYEMAFLELLLPQTLGARLLAHRHGMYVNPFNDRLLIKACMSVSPQLRASGEMNEALHAAAGAPEIAMTGDLKNDQSVMRQVKKMFAGV